MVTSASCYIANETFHGDLQVPYIKYIIKQNGIKYHNSLTCYPNALLHPRLAPVTHKRLKQNWPTDLMVRVEFDVVIALRCAFFYIFHKLDIEIIIWRIIETGSVIHLKNRYWFWQIYTVLSTNVYTQIKLMLIGENNH